ncbi:uncharacterized protein BJX67DRAFT_381053 [Aspergillus lucknowensis]|uniref:Uncharacterized protein n=1 Tax=Aspergillus lucknowensis TaxID=176173 RepID=A0ABR4LS52_9EURO
MSSLDDYLDDAGFDLDDYDLGDYDTGDYDFGDYGSSDYDSGDYGSSDYDYGDYDYGDYDYGDYPTSTSSSSYPTTSSSYDDWLDDYSGDSSDSSDSSDSYDYGSSDYPTNGDLPPGLGSDYPGIGTDYSNMKTSDKCVKEAAFKTTGPKVDLAFDVIFLVLFLAVGAVAAFRLLKSKQKGAAIGKWFLFPVSLFFAILSILINMITLILSQCLMMRIDKYNLAQIAVRWFESLSVFLLIVLILLPICLKLQQGGGKFASLTLVVHSVWLGLCGIFLLVGLATYSRIQDAIYRTQDSIDANLPKASRGVNMAYFVFLFLAALLGGANMFFAFFRKANIRKGAILIGIPALGVSTLILTLVLMGGFADREYGKKDRSAGYFEKSGDAQVFLSRLFYAISFLCALLIAGSHQEVDDSPAQPVAPMSQPANEWHQPTAPAPEQTHAPVPVPAPYGSPNVA